ncbi:MAG: ribonuclease protein subunit [Candidatus Methanomethylophilaceae archaeon]|jgi:ribonuclease P protein subunit POP4|nr:ribonuclease protein subunit [Candidatus Methanomethylophilaceae archaeon]HIJ00916.1 ribonuclease P protein subunit [Candidatus Methanomethylophilaceae archaeon]
MNKKELMRMELIGLHAEIVSEGPYQGIEGKVVDETKNTFAIQTVKGERTVPKKGNEFLFTHEGRKIAILGSEILHRPEDRIKKVR